MAYRTPEEEDADKMLDIYIYDYLLKRKHNESAQIFLREAGVPHSPTAIDAPAGFLFEWWSVFWDEFISRYKPMGPTKEAMHEAEDHRNLLNQQQLQQLRHNMWLQPSVSNTSCCSETSNMLNALAKRKLEESRNCPPVGKDALTVEGKKPKYCNEMVGQVLDLSRALLLRPVEATDSHVGKTMHDARARDHNPQLLMFPGFVGLMPNLRDTVSDGSVYGAYVTGRPVNDSPLEGWPLEGGGSRNCQPQVLKRGQEVVQHLAQSIDPNELVQLPICLSQLGDQIGGASGSGANDYGAFVDSCQSLELWDITEDQAVSACGKTTTGDSVGGF